jgi:hypothetical protein
MQLTAMVRPVAMKAPVRGQAESPPSQPRDRDAAKPEAFSGRIVYLIESKYFNQTDDESPSQAIEGFERSRAPKKPGRKPFQIAQNNY